MYMGSTEPKWLFHKKWNHTSKNINAQYEKDVTSILLWEIFFRDTECTHRGVWGNWDSLITVCVSCWQCNERMCCIGVVWETTELKMLLSQLYWVWQESSWRRAWFWRMLNHCLISPGNGASRVYLETFLLILSLRVVTPVTVILRDKARRAAP